MPEDLLYEWTMLEDEGLPIPQIRAILCDRYPGDTKAIEEWALHEASELYGHEWPESMLWED